MDQKDPYSRGFDARICGEPLSANPYPIRTEAAFAKAWAEGWHDQNVHLNARDDALDQIGWFGPPAAR
jgi:hypothetical protein